MKGWHGIGLFVGVDKVKSQVMSAGVILVRGSKVLLLRAFQYWDFPKGLVEKNEKPLHAAIREVEEETGITDLNFKWGQDFYETEVYGNQKVARYFLASSGTETVQFVKNAKTGIYEHHEYRWCTQEEARKLLGDRVRKALDWAAEKI